MSLNELSMKKRLIILSDLWGREKSEWVNNYIEILKNEFDIEYYDCCELGGIDKSGYSEAEIHKQFVNGGIERAVEKLITCESDKVNILAFSVGGTIAWKFGLESDKIDSLTCVSSTRLRYETIKPNGNITLYFGGNDAFKPELKWLKSMDLIDHILQDKGHEVYRESNFAEQLSLGILTT